ncbi:glycoside hydrolase family 55 protein [Sodiomyces alcalophilus JCM 7366]|uniref:glycoside hydrolase family 55 protein n=1 Tax=Sodiomyces alcalophilus JCM 7366 TaxID=591952 RepID=UPI0039B56ED0
MAQQEQLGSAPFAPASGYQVWRNVKDYGAVGDGITDDTAAINLAISDGQRCGPDCGTSTVVPAVVYFPAGTYLVSSPIIQYYNTQFLGDPNNVPTILGASSFVGLGVITSSPYVSENEGWYLNTANFLRSIRNFKIDIRLTDPTAYICGIHWQVSQATSLENIEFYMQFNTDNPDNTQQGIYMENGSGGFMADLTFVGGNFGAYFGNQQFTTDHLVFVYCSTAVQVHWDWAWTMHDFIIEGCGKGLSIVGVRCFFHHSDRGQIADYSFQWDPNAQTVGSLALVDSIIVNTDIAVESTLRSEDATSFLLQNIALYNVRVAVLDVGTGETLLNGGDKTIDGWGYGRIVEGGAESTFQDGGQVPPIQRVEALTGEAYENQVPNLYARRRPKYYNEPLSNIMNVKALGAQGDGQTDDTAVLNAILAGAANTSSIVHFPHGVYKVTDTLRVPIGSRIIGQAWSQIMGTGAKFENEDAPRPVVRVADPGDVGIIEIQDMLFTVSGPTAGAIVLQWNAQEATQGSVGMWDSHIRVGGAVGSNLQASDCPKQTGGAIKSECKAASLMVHLTKGSTAYLENVWAWVADHDLDTPDRQQVNVYAGRGMLIESRLAYLWGTSSEHATMYQYQLAGARNILMSTIQTETPYFQPMGNNPAPYLPGLFPEDPTFNHCETGDQDCRMAWGARIVDSETVYMLSAGVYSWFNNYGQSCLDTMDCQQRAFEVEQSYDVWLYNLCTKGIVELISPHNDEPTMAADNQNGALSSVLAWLRGARETTGPRDFPGFRVYEPEDVEFLPAADDVCKMALTGLIKCHDEVEDFQSPRYRGSLENATLTDLVCQSSCGESLSSWVSVVQRVCSADATGDGPPILHGARMYAGWNETCLLDPTTGRNCNDVVDDFTPVASIEEMPHAELCSFCQVERLAMMQRTPYSWYDDFWKSQLECIYSTCDMSGDTDVLLPDLNLPDNGRDSTFCLTEEWYTTSRDGESCEEIAWAHTTSSAALFMANQLRIISCAAEDPIPAGTELCIPPSCGTTYMLQDEDTCASIERNSTLSLKHGDVARYNPWVGFECALLQNISLSYGTVLCLGPLLGDHELDIPGGGDTTKPPVQDGYSSVIVPPPEDADVAEGTTPYCGVWHVASAQDTCVTVCMEHAITANLLMQVNPSLGTDMEECTSELEVGVTYCVAPYYDWEHYDDEEDD